MTKEIRWKQRLQNLEKAYAQLEKGLKIQTPNDIEKQGIIQSFEFTFELAWKTLKDYLENEKIAADFPRDVIKQAFHYNIIEDGEGWIDMLEKRNLAAHTYDEANANTMLDLIRQRYWGNLKQVVDYLKQKKAS